MANRRVGLVLAPLLALLVALSAGAAALGQQATPESTVVQGEDTRSFPASIHEGSCTQLGATAYQLAPIGLPEGGQIVGEPAIAAYESVTTIPSVTIDQLVNGDYVVAISKSPQEVDTIVACGLIGGLKYDNALLFSAGPIGAPQFGAIVKLTEENGGVTVVVSVMTNVLGETASASPAASPAESAQAASPAAGEEQTVGQQTLNQQTVTMGDIFFDPQEITVPANTDVTLTLTNNGAAVHNFNVDELEVHSGDIQPGQQGTVTIKADEGRYEFYCSVPGHREAGMTGTLIVQIVQ